MNLFHLSFFMFTSLPSCIVAQAESRHPNECSSPNHPPLSTPPAIVSFNQCRPLSSFWTACTLRVTTWMTDHWRSLKLDEPEESSHMQTPFLQDVTVFQGHDRRLCLAGDQRWPVFAVFRGRLSLSVTALAHSFGKCSMVWVWFFFLLSTLHSGIVCGTFFLEWLAVS